MAQSGTEHVQAARESLRAKIVFLVLLSTFATAAAIAGISAHSIYSFVREQIHGTHPLILERGAERVRTWLQEGQTEMERIARAKSLGRWRGTAAARSPSEGRDPELTQILEDLLPLARTFAGLVVLDDEGNLRAAVGSGSDLSELLRVLKPKKNAESELLDVMATAHLRKALTGADAPLLQIFDMGQVAPLPITSVPLRDANESSLGSLHGLFRRAGIAAQLRTDVLRDGGNVYLVAGDGRVVAAEHDHDGHQVHSLPLAMFQAAGGAKVQEFAGEDGERAMGSALPVGALGWTLVVVQTVDEALQPLIAILTRILVADLAIVLLFALLASQIAKTIVRPIRALAAGARRISQGALDVEISAPKSDDEIGLLIGTFNDMAMRLRKSSQENERIQRALEKQNRALQQANQLLALLSTTDGLTKLHNHRYFQDQLTQELKRVRRSGDSLSLIICDIDDFKKLNDSFGHAAGDEVLVGIAQILKDAIRETDILARYGGEEFVVVAVSTKLEGARVLAEKIRTAVSESSFIIDNSMRPKRLTLSLGVAEFRGSRKKLFASADDALYRAKAAGKDCVVVAEADE